MTSIRKFAYATLLVISTVSFVPTLASAQEPARGRFTLTHDVRWGNAKVPAGDYAFSFDPMNISSTLMLTKVSGTQASFIVLVAVTDQTRPTDVSRLKLETKSDGTYVSSMELPEFGMTLHFNPPPHSAEKQIAKTLTTASASR